jgi:hypothetical protein
VPGQSFSVQFQGRPAPRAGLADPRPVRVFPGLKPEGLARNSSGTGVVVVFDASADAPRWMEQPWPALR